jgi:N-carbamoyl-L-amino-acid hydrolase
MIEEGGDPDAVLRGPGLPPATFVEMHIEQGPVLLDAGEPYALVDGVRGGLRYRTARIEGVWAHSGGAPRHLRSDAVFALADLVTALDALWADRLEEGKDLAVTFGRVDAASPEHAFAKVPGRVGFCLDLRSDDAATLDAVDGSLREIIASIEAKRGVKFVLGEQSRSRPSSLSGPLADRIIRAARGLGTSPRRMLSGGGHDAAAFAQAGWDSVMVFLRNWNGSHNPDEGMDPADLADAVRAVRMAWTEAGPGSER